MVSENKLTAKSKFDGVNAGLVKINKICKAKLSICRLTREWGIKYNLLNVKLEDLIPMKKFFALILALCMIFAAVACDGGVGEQPTQAPTEQSTIAPTEEPTVEPTEEPTVAPTEDPTAEPTEEPTAEPTEEPTAEPTEEPTVEPTEEPTVVPTEQPTVAPTEEPTAEPTEEPTVEPTEEPTVEPTEEPTVEPTEEPTVAPTEEPTAEPTEEPTVAPTEEPTVEPTEEPTNEPEEPSESETQAPADENLEPVESARVDVDYYFAVEQGELGRTLYLNGGIDGFYPTSASALSEAIRIRLEETEGGYYAYFIKNAVKNYINVEFVAVLGRITFETHAKTVFAFDSELKTLTTVIGEKTYYLGMYGEQRYFSVSEEKYASESFVAYLCEAACDHQFIGDADGHSSLACAKCGAAAGDRVPHGESYSVSQLGKRTTYCSDCGYIVKVELCDGNHWLSDADGHREGACEICGTAAGAKSEHGSIMAEYCTATSYSIGCATCGFAYYTKEIPETLTYLIGAMAWGKSATTYFQVNDGNKPGTLTVDGVAFPYGSVTGSTAASTHAGQVLFNRAHSDTSGASDAQQYRIDVGEAKYLVFKIRTNVNTQHMSLYFSTSAKNGLGSLTLPLSSLKNGQWGVVVVDLAATFPNHYVKDTATGSYLVDTFYFTMNGFMATTSIDVAYMAFVEGDLDDVDVLVDESKAIYVAGTSVTEINIGEGGSDEDETVEQETTEQETTEQETTEQETTEQETAAPGVELLLSPSELAEPPSKQGTCDLEVMSEGGLQFVRLDNFVPAGTTSKWGGVNFINGDVGVTGQYMVMKLRIGKNGLAQTYLSMFIRSTGSGLVADMRVDVKVAEDGEWHVIVIDLSTRVKDAATYFAADTDGKYHARYVQIRPFSNNQTGAEADDYMDIAYIAFCDSRDDLAGIVSETTYEWSTSKTASDELKVADHSCAKHLAGELQSKAENGVTVYTAICSSCGNACYEKIVPESVSKFYTGKDFATTATTYYNAGKGSVEYDSENCVVFGRESGNLQLLWHRAQNDLKYNTRSNETTTQDIGNARFFVIRLKTSNTARTLKLNYSTTAKNSDTAVATEEFTVTSFDITGKTGVKAGDTYCTNSGYTTVTFPISSITEGEWTTFVIDLVAVMGEYHGKVGDAESYIMDTFYFDENSQTGNLDVEYMAFVEGDWNDVCALVGEGDVINITAKNGTCETKSLVAAE